ncbi:MAG TPA: hypothetical protein VNX28_15395, partial [Gemmataceae bacterium]|nr:hypothetical protein [Gemmataceae bacterium]
WAWRQDENFLTETLAVVLEHLLLLAPAVGTRLVRQLTDGLIELPAEDASAIKIRTQVEAGSVRPDLEISSPHCLVWVEVKAESKLRVGHLERYRERLSGTGIQQTRLVLLTRYPVNFEHEEARPDLEIRWYKLAEWFESEIPAAEEAGKVAEFLVRQFLGFLEARSMTVAQVSKYMPEGLRALSNLMNMLSVAAEECDVTVSNFVRRDYFGLNLEGRKYWIGVNFSEPEKLSFRTRSRIDPERAAKLGAGELHEDKQVPGGFAWYRKVELDSESIHFFSLLKPSQKQWLESYLRVCLDQARSIETPDQPPIPKEPDDGN